MSDIYLTKVERKTIFTQGLIYVLFTFVISDLTVTGPYIFCIIPWLFLLGIMGVNKFYHPVMTVVISTITTFIASLFKYNGLNIHVLTSVLVAFTMTSAGLIVGLAIKDFVLEHRLVKQLSVHKKILNILVIVLLTIGSITLYAARYGNVFGFIKSRIELNNYITDSLKEEQYNIDNLEFVTGTFARYIYVVNIEDIEYKINIGKANSILNVQEVQKSLNISLENKFLESINSDNMYKVNVAYEYRTGSVMPVDVIATISLDNLDTDNLEMLTKATKDLKQICTFEDENNVSVGKVILSINGGIEVIEKDNFKDITEQYLLNSIMVETLD